MTKFTRIKKYSIRFFVLAVSLLIGLLIAELICRVIEKPAEVHGGGGGFEPHAVVGWVPSAGERRVVTEEFDVTYRVNSRNMNGRMPLEEDKNRKRIAAVGDSHTFALGVDLEDAWPNILDKQLCEKDEGKVVYNLGVVGYSLHQYYFWLMEKWDELSPEIVIVGVSMATDLYDLLPPHKGGWVYGMGLGRRYFDLDDNKSLVIENDPGANAEDAADSGKMPQTSRSLQLRFFLDQHSALYRRLKRSPVAFAVSVYARPGGESLWPGMENVCAIDLNPDQQYAWDLAEQILLRLRDEVTRRKAKLLVVNIPYIAQVYDSVWSSSFGLRPERYDRYLGGKRLDEICTKGSIQYLDLTQPFVDESRSKKRWLHYKADGHPNPEGQALIAAEIRMALEKRDWLK